MLTAHSSNVLHHPIRRKTTHRQKRRHPQHRKIDGEKDAKIELHSIATIDDKQGFENKETKLKAKILDQFRDDKIRVFKYKRRKRYRKSQGHRQYLTQIEVC